MSKKVVTTEVSYINQAIDWSTSLMNISCIILSIMRNHKKDEEQEEEAADSEAEEEADVEPVNVEEEPAGDEGSVSPAVWYSIGGVVAAIGAYFACCKKSDDGYSRIQ